MDPTLNSSKRPGRFHRGYLVLGLVLAVALGILCYRRMTQVMPWNHRPSAPLASQADDTQRFPTSHFQNTRADVKYVGDESCAGCHPSQAKSYQRHPMGRSLAPI